MTGRHATGRPRRGLLGAALVVAVLTTSGSCSVPSDGTERHRPSADHPVRSHSPGSSFGTGSTGDGAAPAPWPRTCGALPLRDRLPTGAVLSSGQGDVWRVSMGPRMVLALRTSASARVHLLAGRLCADGDAPVLAVTRTAVSSAAWRGRGRARSLVVTPTWAVRGWEGAAAAVVAELGDRVPEVRTPGMTDQLRCHAEFAPQKPTWDLEPARPAVGYLATVAARCNPGALTDPDGR